MTDADRRLWVEKCAELLHLLLVDIRAFTWEEGQSERVNVLADIAHNVPHFMVGRDDHVPNYLRDEFVRYARRYHPGADPALNKYVHLIDMNEVAFRNFYRQPMPWPEPVAAVAAS